MDQRFYDQITFHNRSQKESAVVHNAWLGFRGLKVFPKFSEKATLDVNVYYVKALNRKQISLDVRQGVYVGGNSGFGGMMLAISLGCKEIMLLGADFKIDEKRKK